MVPRVFSHITSWTNVASVGSAVNSTRNVLVLLIRKGPPLETPTFTLSSQVLKEPMTFLYKLHPCSVYYQISGPQ